MADITIQDLTNVVSLIDLAVERGAFKGNEILAIGRLREKVITVVDESQARIAENSVIENKEKQ